MAYFIFNDIDSRDMGVVVKKLPSHTKPMEKLEKISIPGRDGYLTVSENAYEYSSFYIECGLKKDADLYAVASWLKGSGNLVCSDDLTKYYEARIDNAIPFDIIFKYWRDFIINFDAQPFMKSVTAKTVTLTPLHLSETETVAGTYKSLPKTTLTGTGTFILTIGSNTFTLTGVDTEIVIDSELMECYEDNGATNANSKLALVDDFPILEVGENAISISVKSGTFTSCVFEYHDRWF